MADFTLIDLLEGKTTVVELNPSPENPLTFSTGLTRILDTITTNDSEINHNALSNLLIGDAHTHYALLLGRAGGQTLIGSILSGENLTLGSTSHATKGKILLGTSAYDEVNNRLGIGTITPRTSLELYNDGAILAIGTFDSGWQEPNLGAGSRMLWYPRKSAFRAGRVEGPYAARWDNANIGNSSIALGLNNQASGTFSTAIGAYNNVTTAYAVALGGHNSVGGDWATAIGYNSSANGDHSHSYGRRALSTHAGCSVFTDGVDADFNSTGVNKFEARFAGGYNLTGGTVAITSTPALSLNLNGQIKIAGGTPAVGKLLRTDADGLATWVVPFEFSQHNIRSAEGTGSSSVAAATDRLETAARATNYFGIDPDLIEEVKYYGTFGLKSDGANNIIGRIGFSGWGAGPIYGTEYTTNSATWVYYTDVVTIPKADLYHADGFGRYRAFTCVANPAAIAHDYYAGAGFLVFKIKVV